MLEVGKLYSCEEYLLFLYPDMDTAVPMAPAGTSNASADEYAVYWTNRLRKPVCSLEKSIPLLVLNMEENFYEVLAGDKKGWIIYEGWTKIREINYAENR